MALDERIELSAEEIDAFLRGRQTGVLSLAHDDEPYAIPISYGYDGADRQFFLRLVSTPESDKRDFLASTPQARLVVYDDDDVYHSVVATGTLEEISRDDLTQRHVEQFGDARRPLFELWGESKADLKIQLYRLDPDELRGLRIETDTVE